MNPFTADRSEPLGEGGTWLLDLVAAVDYLARGYRPNFTVWDALEEALRWTLPTDDDTARNVPDPLAHTLCRFLDSCDAPVAVALQTAVRRWVVTMADRCNNGRYWPHPVARRGFPPPHLDSAADDSLT